MRTKEVVERIDKYKKTMSYISQLFYFLAITADVAESEST